MSSIKHIFMLFFSKVFEKMKCHRVATLNVQPISSFLWYHLVFFSSNFDRTKTLHQYINFIKAEGNKKMDQIGHYQFGMTELPAHFWTCANKFRLHLVASFPPVQVWTCRVGPPAVVVNATKRYIVAVEKCYLRQGTFRHLNIQIIFVWNKLYRI